MTYETVCASVITEIGMLSSRIMFGRTGPMDFVI